MTLAQIYDEIVFRVWGAGSTTVSQNYQTRLVGANGIIANIHRKIQRDHNYWFMESAGTIAVIANTRTYALPANFKEIMRSGLRFWSVDADAFLPPLSPLNLGEPYENFSSASDVSEFPTFYEIYAGSLSLYPMPSADQTLYKRYYAFLDRPSDVLATWQLHTDVLTEHGNDVITFLSCADIFHTFKEHEEAMMMEKKAAEALEILLAMDKGMRRAEIDSIEYRGF